MHLDTGHPTLTPSSALRQVKAVGLNQGLVLQCRRYGRVTMTITRLHAKYTWRSDFDVTPSTKLFRRTHRKRSTGQPFLDYFSDSASCATSAPNKVSPSLVDIPATLGFTDRRVPFLPQGHFLLPGTPRLYGV